MTDRRFIAACVQLRSGREVASNVSDASNLIREAHRRGAHYVQTPEMTALMERGRSRLIPKLHVEQSDLALQAFRALAVELGIWLHIGSLAIRVGPEQAANRAFLIAPDGVIAARYDKIHMFDVDLPGGESYRESAIYKPGDKAVSVDVPWTRLGLSICYDIRFPHLYRTLAEAGAEILAIPAAFTRQTGEAHWHVLQRARAIETGCFVISAAQGGKHEDGRETYGHSLILDPWGRVLAEAGTEPGVITAEIDLDLIAKVRGQVPSLANSRHFDPPVVAQSEERAAS
ncbi:MAG: carbon-nitrogen hydrolase family protein [Pseudomonadota bacterium]